MPITTDDPSEKQIRFASGRNLSAIKFISRRILGREESFHRSDAHHVLEREESFHRSDAGALATAEGAMNWPIHPRGAAVPRRGTQTPRMSILRSGRNSRSTGHRASFGATVSSGRGGGGAGSGGGGRHARMSHSSISQRSSDGGSGLGLEETRRERCSVRCNLLSHLPGCSLAPSKSALSFMNRVIDSSCWRVFLFIFSLVLLFGLPIQELLFPKEADLAFDVLFFVCFVFFSFDIVMRSFIFPDYFLLQLRGMDWRHDAQSNRVPRPLIGGEGNGDCWGGLCPYCPCCRGFRLGSFMFWCDVASTLSLLYDISFINLQRRRTAVLGITVGPNGLPDSWYFGTDDGTSINLNAVHLVNVAKTARIARFVRAPFVVHLSSKVNWYWLPDRLNPFFWARRLKGKDNGDKARTILEELSAHEGTTATAAAGGGGSAHVRRRSSFLRPPNAGASGSLTGVSGAGGNCAGPQSSLLGSSCHDEGPLRNMLGLFRYRSRGDEEVRRKASIRIQRAWRAYRDRRSRLGSYSQQREGSGIYMGDEKRAGGTDSVFKTKTKLPAAIRRTLSNAESSVADSSSQKGQGVSEDSHVGSAMRELTSQRVALGIMIALVFTVLFSYQEWNQTVSSTMLLLHSQTQYAGFKDLAIQAARSTVVPNLFQYVDSGGVVTTYPLPGGADPGDLRAREMLVVTVTDSIGGHRTSGTFSVEEATRNNAVTLLVSTIFILFIWFFGMTSFAGPILTLVVVPIERMIRLLNMLTKDPLGYQSSDKYKKFVREEDLFVKNTKWTKDVLKGMETSFLMSTILRIGSLMKVGFGSAGVEIIRSNLQKGQTGTQIFLNTQGSTVSCIFLFCDIRQFTDATECLQEEVFVFTNKAAAVVHSICHSCGGSANKNVGDAFLLSWELKRQSLEVEGGDSFVLPYTPERDMFHGTNGEMGQGGSYQLVAKNNEADKALLSVVKICIALYHDKFFIESIKEDARERLLTKLSKRRGPVVQMGFSLHAGKSVQGAIGSQRKLDATYVSKTVEMAEFLESSTKKYSLKMLMSDAFHRLLHPSNRRRCRKVDQIMFLDDDSSDTEDPVENGEYMELYTFDMDIDALWRSNMQLTSNGDGLEGSSTHHTGQENISESDSLRHTSDDGLAQAGKKIAGARPSIGRQKSVRRRVSLIRPSATFRSLTNATQNPAQTENMPPTNFSLSGEQPASVPVGSVSDSDFLNERGVPNNLPELKLPTGPAMYSASVWVDEDMRKIRQMFSDGLFYQKFSSGLQSFYSRDWEHASQCFRTVLERFEDGPSRYFLNQIEENNGMPPRNFAGYGTA